MRFLHTADWHLGQCRRFPGYLERHEKVLTSVFELAIERKVDYMLAVGDIFHRGDTKHEERELLYRLLTKYDGKVRLIISDGNHDETTIGNSQLTPLALMSNYFKTISVVSVKPTLIALDQVDFQPHDECEHYVLSIPWGGYTQQQIVEIVEKHYRGLKYVKTFVVTIHEGFFGYSTDVGYVSPKGPTLPNLDYVTYWAGGDIHKCQKISNLDNAWYSGAPAQWDFGDKLPKGILIVDTNNPKQPEFVEVISKPLVVVTDVTKIPEEDCYVKLRVPYDKIPTNLPDKVVTTDPYTPDADGVLGVDDVPLDVSLLDDMTDGLAEFLANEGLSMEEQAMAMSEIEEVVRVL